MAKYRRWIGSGLGWAVGGPIGALIGFLVGQGFDNAAEMTTKGGSRTSGFDPRMRHHTGAGDFAASLLVLSAAVMKADGKVLKSELNFVKTFFNKQFGSEFTKQQMQALKELLDKDIPVRQVCEQIRYNMQHPLRLQLLHYLFGISQADGHVHKSEVDEIHRIARALGISEKDFESIRNMFYKDTKSAYKVLEIEATATNDEVKKAFRRMAVKHHPDKVSHLGEEYQKAAKDKFQQVQDAYDAIKKERGMK